MLHFQCSGEWYTVNNHGHIRRDDMPEMGFSPTWVFLGISTHHWHNHITLRFNPKTDPKEYIKGIVWDSDHGTTRVWGGCYCGRLPKITAAYNISK